MLKTVIEYAGMKELYESSRKGVSSKALATVPAAVAHFTLTLFERPVQAELTSLLLLPAAEGGSSWVLLHGMGGTGKVSGRHRQVKQFLRSCDCLDQPDGDSGGGSADFSD